MPEAVDTLSTVRDSVAAATPLSYIWPRASICAADEAPFAVGHERTSTGRVAYTLGQAPQERPELPGYDSGIMSLVVVTFLLLSLNFSHYSTFLKNFAEDLWNVRRRVSEGVHTVSETRVLLSLVLLACVTEGILLFSAIAPQTGLFNCLIGCVCIAAGYYAWQILAYNVTGFAFADQQAREQWLKGFNASQSLLGLALVIPALFSLFYPSIAPIMISLGILLYATARIVFICKGFRLFYDNIFSIVYFILYFCTLEIAPLLLIYKIFTGSQEDGIV